MSFDNPHQGWSAMVCKEKRKLVEAYETATEKYSTVVTKLRQQMGTLSKADYDVLYQETEALPQDLAAGRIKLQTHVQDHPC
jgi:hypothetical protein